LLRVRIRGQSEKAIRRYDHPLPPREAGERRQDPVADFDVLHGTSYGKNAADAFIADNGWERGAQWIDALCDQEVTEVDRRKFDANKDLARAGSVRLGMSAYSRPSTGLP
jgi:hypothetical protein